MKLKDIPDLTLDQVLGAIRLFVDMKRPDLSDSLDRYYNLLLKKGEKSLGEHISCFMPNGRYYKHGTFLKLSTDSFVERNNENIKYSLFFWFQSRVYSVQEVSSSLIKADFIFYTGKEMEFFFKDGESAKYFYEKRFCLVSIN